VGLADFGRRATHHLSHGEKPLFCLAGVLECNPEILALDEPTTDLYPRDQREFKTLLRQIPETKLMATHDWELVVEMCSRVVILDCGAVVADDRLAPSASISFRRAVIPLALALANRLSASGIASRFFCFHNNHTTREYRPPSKIPHPARPMA
jgi:energy-coupling factor transporter ATP-binding protein EcfA2